MTEVGEKTDFAGGRVQKKTNRINRVVRNRKGVHLHVANFERIAGVEKLAIDFDLQLRLDGFARLSIAINRQIQFRGETDKPGDVVGMFVRDENAVQTFRRAGNRGESVANLASAEPGVDEQTDFAGFEIGAISVGTTAENRELNRHAGEVKSSTQPSQRFSRKWTEFFFRFGCFSEKENGPTKISPGQ
jgi:hypothetical protein